MNIAIEGCIHGDLDNLYKTLQHLEKSQNTKIDLLLCCCDFQAVRNKNDLKSLAVLDRFRSMNSFWKHYFGIEVRGIRLRQKVKVEAKPIRFVTVFYSVVQFVENSQHGDHNTYSDNHDGGNREILDVNIRIGGLSRIYKHRDYKSGHYERPPYDQHTIRSAYHVREYDVRKLSQVEEPIDIFLSHDWPVRITDHVNWEKLVRKKPFFKQEIEEKILGSQAAARLLEKLKPKYWFSAHLHYKFSALVQHGEGGPVTKFLALDKCLPGRDFL